ncbi:hypothetical protein, partial [Rossellomorea sp. BNER]|uniref:hypothetical protein n=1 Tax=Rossellomorea sp. BNER TaxID=2962031 RepID=UPI003AF2A195|nr:hypothetical protein [Rossellomorea sp. BNER]
REIAQYIKDLKTRRELVLGSIQKALLKLDEVRSEEKIENVGGFFNRFLKKYVLHFIENNTGVASDVIAACETTGATVPRLVEEYSKMKDS